MIRSLLIGGLATLSLPLCVEAQGYEPPPVGLSLDLVYNPAGDDEPTRGRDTVIATGPTFAIHRYENFSSLTALAPDDTSYYVEFSPLSFFSCDMDMPSDEQVEKILSLWPLELGDSASFASGESSFSYRVVGDGRLMIENDVFDVWTVESQEIGNSDEFARQDIVIQKSPNAYLGLLYGSGDREQAMKVNHVAKFKLSDEEISKLDKCADLLNK